MQLPRQGHRQHLLIIYYRRDGESFVYSRIVECLYCAYCMIDLVAANEAGLQ